MSILPNFTSNKNYVNPYFSLLSGKETDINVFFNKAFAPLPKFSAIAIQSLFSEMGIDTKLKNMLDMQIKVLEQIMNGENFTVKTEWGYVVFSQGKAIDGATTSFTLANGLMSASLFTEKAAENVIDNTNLSSSIVLVDGDTMTYEAHDKWIDEIGKAIGTRDISGVEKNSLKKELENLGFPLTSSA